MWGTSKSLRIYLGFCFSCCKMGVGGSVSKVPSSLAQPNPSSRKQYEAGNRSLSPHSIGWGLGRWVRQHGGPSSITGPHGALYISAHPPCIVQGGLEEGAQGGECPGRRVPELVSPRVVPSGHRARSVTG